MNRENMTRCMRDGCTYQQMHEINDYIDKLQQENKQLKEQLDQEKDDFKEFVKLGDRELKKCIDNLEGTDFLDAFCVLQWINATRKENKQLKEELKFEKQCKNRFFKINNKSYDGIIVLEQLKQRDEVIDEAIRYFDAYKQEVVIGRTRDEKLIKDYWLPSQCSKRLLEILQKYKGDNK